MLLTRRRTRARARQQVCQYMLDHESDFSPFMEDDIAFPDVRARGGAVSLHAHALARGQYMEKMQRAAEWGGHLELHAAARMLRLHVVVHKARTAVGAGGGGV